MKSKIAFALLVALSISANACSQNETTSDNSNSTSSISSFVPSVPSKEEGVSLEKFTEEVDKLGQINERPFRMSFQITETVVGTYPICRRNSSDLLSEGVYNSTLVVESADGNLSKSKIVGERPNITSTADEFIHGVQYTASGWLSYHANRRTFLNSAQEGEGFKEAFKLDSFRMWMVSWGNRLSNSTVEGTYFDYDEHERTHDEKGYCKTVYVKEYSYLDGTYSRYNAQPKEYHGSYEFVLNGTIEYLD